MLPHGLLPCLSDGPVSAVVSFRTSAILDNLRIPCNFLAILLLPLAIWRS
jgi:hypothetical protein